MKTDIKITILSNQLIAPGAYLLSFERPFEFLPGQVIAISDKPDGEPRLYSIASGNNNHVISLLYTVQPGGKFTPWLSIQQKGHVLFTSLPFGRFTGTDQKAYWIATGTGIAPFASMFQSGQGSNKILIHGNRTLQGFYFQELFSPIMGNNYIRCCSRENPEGCFHGRVTDYLKQMPDLPADVPYYLCGSAEMVVDVRDILIKRGIPFDLIVAEIFF